MCPGWAARGECTTNPAYMLTHCPLSCKKCTPKKKVEVGGGKRGGGKGAA
jgi:hypothetical protein